VRVPDHLSFELRHAGVKVGGDWRAHLPFLKCGRL
jgi:hypothetical protein